MPAHQPPPIARTDLSPLAKAVAKVGGQRGWLSDPLDRNGEYISDATLGLDEPRCAGVAFELASEAKNLHVDAAIEDILMHARGLQQVLTAKWAADWTSTPLADVQRNK